MSKVDEIKVILPQNVKECIFNGRNNIQFDKLQEIRLRIFQPVMIKYNNKEIVFNDLAADRQTIDKCIQFVSNYSLYACQEDVRQGFITVKGGHRIGVIGKAVYENEFLKSQRNISFINIRVAHQIKGCADSVMDFICRDGCIKHTLIVSPPGCGKTTLLRDIIRQISYGTVMGGQKVAVVDERSEIAACFEGIPQNDLGPRTDVCDCCRKKDGMIMMVRSMSPDVIAIDEIGDENDINAIRYVINCGCTILGTIHANCLGDLKRKPGMDRLIKEGVFSRIIVLSGKDKAGTIDKLIEYKCEKE